MAGRDISALLQGILAVLSIKGEMEVWGKRDDYTISADIICYGVAIGLFYFLKCVTMCLEVVVSFLVG